MTTYKDAGVDIANADATKEAMKASIDQGDPRVLNTVGAFASLVDGNFSEMKEPILVLKTEEPGSKQKLAFENGMHRSICFDTVNHLINDVIMMGAKPLYMQDCIICGGIEKDAVTELVAGFADACREQDCVLVGGETSEQPGILDPGSYVLSASLVGVVDKPNIIDGSTIAEGDIVLALASNGLHTNGYTLVRKLLDENDGLAEQSVGDETFLEAIMKPHICYYHCLKGLFGNSALHGLAHITGGGIKGNLGRILKPDLDAIVDVSQLQVPPVFSVIQGVGNVPEEDMLQTYNLGAGVTSVVAPEALEDVIDHLAQQGQLAYPIGTIAAGNGHVQYEGVINW